MCACATPCVSFHALIAHLYLGRTYTCAGARVSCVRECEPKWSASPTPVKARVLVL